MPCRTGSRRTGGGQDGFCCDTGRPTRAGRGASGTGTGTGTGAAPADSTGGGPTRGARRNP
ncbi:hypothetical protein [Novispirillum itersonii]|uniref:Uncharacterized protein n=1 Tax=Novispirillum itersonii TaxID=189 RepID=A0A7X0DM06_NOVIT|nr:hypothetical protein [Novispirillum itersonii]MBB6208727.1 hypothetical protein [Novispirillum itersonii]